MEHPITPPPGLVEQWRDEALNSYPDDENPCPCDIDDARDEHIAIQAARWGANQELEACCKWIDANLGQPPALNLHMFRRPKPPSLKQQALEALDSASYQPGSDFKQIDPARSATIRRALESLPDPQDHSLITWNTPSSSRLTLRSS